MLFSLIGSLTTVSYEVTATLGMPGARALRIEMLRRAVVRRAKKAAAIAARFSEWLEETALRTHRTRDWLSQGLCRVRSRLSAAFSWFRSQRERNSNADELGGEQSEPG